MASTLKGFEARQLEIDEGEQLELVDEQGENCGPQDELMDVERQASSGPYDNVLGWCWEERTFTLLVGMLPEVVLVGFRRSIADIAQRASEFRRNAPEVVQRSSGFRTHAADVVLHPISLFHRTVHRVSVASESSFSCSEDESQIRKISTVTIKALCFRGMAAKPSQMFGDCNLEHARKGGVCKNLVGDVKIDKEPENAGNREALRRMRKVYGTITVQRADDTDLSFLKNIKTIDGWASPVLTIWNNTKLRHISDILPINITGPKPVYYFSNNSRFCHTVDVVQKIEAKVGMKLNWTKSCLKSCEGGSVTEQFLAQLDPFCNRIEGDLVLEAYMEKPPPASIVKLLQIEKINGRLLVIDNDKLKDLSALANLEEIGTSNDPRESLCSNVSFTIEA
ncbi:unnamed protein product [Heligmosomoides polygyrus]|uniref:Recep_L_domain domain-containing protein n=1 Tax=Heligmosomoides polygyrus TaxID=6339 RepID=A0A3P8BIN7_HELPZ|nr:unnamed protein product [Heligmosomoides polygyrus]